MRSCCFRFWIIQDKVRFKPLILISCGLMNEVSSYSVRYICMSLVLLIPLTITIFFCVGQPDAEPLWNIQTDCPVSSKPGIQQIYMGFILMLDVFLTWQGNYWLCLKYWQLIMVFRRNVRQLPQWKMNIMPMYIAESRVV